VEIEGTGFAQELHLRFVRELVALAAVARMTAGDEIFPGGRAPAGARNHVVERKFSGCEHFPAVLAGIAITHQDVLARECARLVRNSAVFEQADDGGHAQRNARGMEKVSVFFFGHSHAFEHQDDCASRSAHVDRLVRRVQDQHRRMKGVAVAVLMDASGQERDRRVVSNRIEKLA